MGVPRALTTTKPNPAGAAQRVSRRADASASRTPYADNSTHCQAASVERCLDNPPVTLIAKVFLRNKGEGERKLQFLSRLEENTRV